MEKRGIIQIYLNDIFENCRESISIVQKEFKDEAIQSLGRA